MPGKTVVSSTNCFRQSSAHLEERHTDHRGYTDVRHLCHAERWRDGHTHELNTVANVTKRFGGSWVWVEKDDELCFEEEYERCFTWHRTARGALNQSRAFAPLRMKYFRSMVLLFERVPEIKSRHHRPTSDFFPQDIFPSCLTRRENK